MTLGFLAGTGESRPVLTPVAADRKSADHLEGSLCPHRGPQQAGWPTHPLKSPAGCQSTHREPQQAGWLSFPSSSDRWASDGSQRC